MKEVFDESKADKLQTAKLIHELVGKKYEVKFGFINSYYIRKGNYAQIDIFVTGSFDNHFKSINKVIVRSEEFLDDARKIASFMEKRTKLESLIIKEWR